MDHKTYFISGAETSRSWQLIWSVFCDCFLLYLMSAFCWLFKNAEGIHLSVMSYLQSAGSLLICNKICIKYFLWIQVLHFFLSWAFPFPFTVFVVLNLKCNMKYKQYSFVRVLFEMSCMLWFFRLTVRCESLFTTKWNKGVYPFVYSHDNSYFPTWNVHCPCIHTLMTDFERD